MKITGKTRLNRRAMEIFDWQRFSCPPLSAEERSATVTALEQIAKVAEFAAEIIRTEATSLKCPFYTDDEEEDVNDSYFDWDTTTELWTKAGKDRVRFTHAGMAMAHDLHEVGRIVTSHFPNVTSRFPNLAELGFKKH